MFNIALSHVKWRRIIDSFLRYFKFSSSSQIHIAQTLPSSSIFGHRDESEDLAYPSQNPIIFSLFFCFHIFNSFFILFAFYMFVHLLLNVLCFQTFMWSIMLSIYQESGICRKKKCFFLTKASLSGYRLIFYPEYALFLIFNITSIQWWPCFS